jgi:hypothetical protein
MVINLDLKNQIGYLFIYLFISEKQSGIQEIGKQTPCPIRTLMIHTTWLSLKKIY